MGKVKELVCVNCGATYQEQEVEYTCPQCGIKGILDVKYHYEEVSVSRQTLQEDGNYSMWRYHELLPLRGYEGIQPLQVGWTPLFRAERLGKKIGLHHLYIKDDGRNPTGSFKDRASAVGVARAIEQQHKVIACSSTGNAASSLAGFAASAGIETYIFVPAAAPEAKVTQLLIYGAHVILVEGTYDQAYYLCNEAVNKWGWYNRNCAINPYLIEGKKTVGFEIVEQMKWEVPDRIFMSVGDGCSIAGAWKAFKEFYQLGLIDKLPKMIGVQAEGCQPLTRSFLTGEPFIPVIPNTLADSIAVGEPRNGQKALGAIAESKGKMISVSDADILQAMSQLSRETGVFGEPAGVTAFAGLLKMASEKEMDPDEKIVTVVTGNGLKDIRSAQKAVGYPVKIKPSLEELEDRFLKEGVL